VCGVSCVVTDMFRTLARRATCTKLKNVKLNRAQASRSNVNVAVKIDLTGDPAARIMIAVFEVSFRCLRAIYISSLKWSLSFRFFD
jgi:hypothetical protein